jgi:cytosine permease
MKLRKRLMGLVEAAPRVRPSGQDLRSWVFFVMLQVGITICVPVFLLGVQLGRHMPFPKMVLAVFVGALVVALLSASTGLVGTYCRLPTALVLRRTFGVEGGKFTTLVLVISTFGWFGVQTELLVHNVRQVIHMHEFFEIGRPALTAIVGFFMCTTAVIGFRALGKVAYLAVPLLILLLCIPLWKGLAATGISGVFDGQRDPDIYSFGFVVSVVSGSYMVGVAVMPDITRFLRSPTDTLAGAAIGLSIAYPLLLCLSAALGAIYASGNLVEIMSKAGFAIPAVFVMFLATWTSNDKNLYEASLSLSTLIPVIPRWAVTALAGVSGTCLAMVGIFDHFIIMLLFLGVFISPIGAVYAVDFWVSRQTYLDLNLQPPAIRIAPFVAWGTGVGLGLATLPKASHGLGLFELSQASTLDALVGAGLAMMTIRMAQKVYGRLRPVDMAL